MFECNALKFKPRKKSVHDQIILAVLRSSEVIPETRTKSKNIAGWNDYIKYLKLTAFFWRNLWRDNSSPLTGH